jgi:hypothetical protein
MEQTLPPQTERGGGFEPARVRQFTVFMDNRVGRLQTLLGTLESAAHPIRALSIEESGETALVRMICDDAENARQTLRGAGFPFAELDLLAVQIPKKNPQPLIAICSVLLTAEINIHYLYPFLLGPRGPALALYVEDPVLAEQLLIKKGFTLIGESDLKS